MKEIGYACMALGALVGFVLWSFSPPRQEGRRIKIDRKDRAWARSSRNRHDHHRKAS